MVRNTFTVKVIFNEGETITQEYKKPIKDDTIDEVNMNLFDKVEEQQEEVKDKIQKVKEEVKEEVEKLKEEVIEEEPKITIEELKELLTEKLDKKNTALSYYRTIKQVYDYFQMNDIYILLQKEQEIIDLSKKNMNRVYSLYPVSYAVY